MVTREGTNALFKIVEETTEKHIKVLTTIRSPTHRQPFRLGRLRLRPGSTTRTALLPDVFVSGVADVYKFGDPVTVSRGATGVVQAIQDPHRIMDTLLLIHGAALAGTDLGKITLLHATLRRDFTEEIDLEPAHVPDPHRGQGRDEGRALPGRGVWNPRCAAQAAGSRYAPGDRRGPCHGFVPLTEASHKRHPKKATTVLETLFYKDVARHMGSELVQRFPAKDPYLFPCETMFLGSTRGGTSRTTCCAAGPWAGPPSEHRYPGNGPDEVSRKGSSSA